MVANIESLHCCVFQLMFKIPDHTQSGTTIDAKSIQVAPNIKFKLTCGECRITLSKNVLKSEM